MDTSKTTEKCSYCGGIEREPTMAEEFMGAILRTTQSLTIAQLAEIAARIGVKPRIVFTEMSAEECTDADKNLAQKDAVQP
jgi:hypothetical protein